MRYEMLREGIQEHQARFAIEKALIEEAVEGETAASARAFLEKQVEIRFQGGEFKGGHAGGNLGKPKRMWAFAPYPAWQTNALRLFEHAAVAAAR